MHDAVSAMRAACSHARAVTSRRHDHDAELLASGVIRCARPDDHRLPELGWAELTPEKVASIPVLGVLRDAAQ